MKKFLFALLAIFSVTTLRSEDEILRSEEEIVDQETLSAFVLPMVSTSAIVEVYDQDGTFHGIVFVNNSRVPDGMSLPGGSMEFGESVESAIDRAILNELNIQITDLKQFHTYSGDSISSRFRPLVEVVFIAQTNDIAAICKCIPDAIIVPYNLIPWDKLDSRYVMISQDYLAHKFIDSIKILPIEDED